MRPVCTARFDHLKERQEEAWDKGTLQFLQIILTFMRYVAAKGPVSDEFRNTFRVDQTAEIVARILREWGYSHTIHSHSFPQWDVKLEFPQKAIVG
jgi:hypothetical protein